MCWEESVQVIFHIVFLFSVFQDTFPKVRYFEYVTVVVLIDHPLKLHAVRLIVQRHVRLEQEAGQAIVYLRRKANRLNPYHNPVFT